MQLQYLLPLIPLALARPSLIPRTEEDCSTAPVFNLPSVNYTSTLLYSTPAHLAVSSATLGFALENSAAYKTSCQGYAYGQQSTSSFFAFAYPINCTDTDATFSYTHYDNKVQINETWTCGGNKYFGTATGILDLQCEETKYQNPSWKQGETYSSTELTCKPYSTSLTPVVTKMTGY